MRTTGITPLTSDAIAALQRIARKPPLPFPFHKYERDFIPKRGAAKGPALSRDSRLVHDPLFLPSWADYELNPCDCPRCIAIRTLADIKEAES